VVSRIMNAVRSYRLTCVCSFSSPSTLSRYPTVSALVGVPLLCSAFAWIKGSVQLSMYLLLFVTSI